MSMSQILNQIESFIGKKNPVKKQIYTPNIGTTFLQTFEFATIN